ncbi:bifunctional 3-(3-hydroxy-phenyl)propionate/3-hydroxycinnamic acid hydroxylase [Oryzicola mucosus]|uniref:Bifunctional 3-(3-hydroxy-phenyl)propionate/3-hydroxycinnamic acid hydroxylase n=1 Tax=Oryzicola mucosus TaxID=2767425 RepID=A0A8J6PZL6_9HYPH|nr:bifunctional 3-(3-hydroxy-phenyl)propionate/3-hydroxycinnamic acid hydroxylase [Oryzicola mucosus]MBD0417212.1 bifunctional 3-(3-hydroxy-phenyl)propionate/3-hydroxycinnamic acid hydroxylase [Oryzicola mucosus]
MPAYPTHVPVVIVGAGPTGLTAANLLSTYGVDVIVLDREPGPMDLPRAIVVDDEGARTLQVFGLDKTYLASTIRAVGSKYFDDAGNCLAETGAGPETYGFAKRQYIYQPELETALRNRLDEQAQGRLFYGSEVTDVEDCDGTTVVSVIDRYGVRHRIETEWVLACDGGRSPIRERLGIAMSGQTYEQDWIVLDMVDDPDASRYSKFFCSSVRPTVSVPAPGQGRRYEFMLLPGETREQVLADDFLADLLKPFRPFRREDLIRKTVYRFHARIADRFREGRVLLLGDAAHLTPPFAGQGMNAGLRDAHNVAWKIATAVKGGASASILDSYEAERRKPAWDMILVAVTMGDFVMPADAEKLRFRDMLLAALEPFPNVRDYLIHMRFKPKPRYQTGLFLDLDRPDFEGSLVGEMLPQPRVPAEVGLVALDERLGVGFALVTQSDDAYQAAMCVQQKSLLGLPLSHVWLDRAALGGRDGGAWMRRDAVARPLLTHRDQVMLVRPDRYCAAVFDPAELATGLRRYEALFSAVSRASSPAIKPAAAFSASP